MNIVIDKIRKFGYFILFCSIIIGILGYLIAHEYLPIESITTPIQDFYANISTELFSLAITILILDKLYEGRADESEKRRLILQMGSPDNAFAVEAVRQLRMKGWLFDGSLQNANLRGANLQGADLSYADLSGSKLSGANLNSSNLAFTNFSNCELITVDFRKASFHTVNLSNTNLSQAKFEKAVIFDVALDNAEMYFCNFKGVIAFENKLDILSKEPLRVAKSLIGTILPNGKKYMGNYNLVGDIEYARMHNIDIKNQAIMKAFYKNAPVLLHAEIPERRTSWKDKYVPKNI